MALPPVLFNRTSLDQQLERGFASIDENFQTLNLCLAHLTFSVVFTLCCALGFQATEQPGKKRSLSNKIFLWAGIVGGAATVGLAVASVSLAFFSLRECNKL